VTGIPYIGVYARARVTVIYGKAVTVCHILLASEAGPESRTGARSAIAIRKWPVSA